MNHGAKYRKLRCSLGKSVKPFNGMATQCKWVTSERCGGKYSRKLIFLGNVALGPWTPADAVARVTKETNVAFAMATGRLAILKSHSGLPYGTAKLSATKYLQISRCSYKESRLTFPLYCYCQWSNSVCFGSTYLPRRGRRILDEGISDS